jgi:hypothetical protein
MRAMPASSSNRNVLELSFEDEVSRAYIKSQPVVRRPLKMYKHRNKKASGRRGSEQMKKLDLQLENGDAITRNKK